jgi:ATP-dependent RNA helicase HelY
VSADTADPFTLDRFQIEAIEAIDAGLSVLVAAPTGSGKTVVAEHAVARAMAEGRRAFYTTPIKALSNQKYGDLLRRYGTGRVGLLTGDNAIDGDAPVVVMTTEVLRNMIYAGRPLDDLAYIILDEVHYLQDAYRGPVWEEVIIHAPSHVRLVCLSATVSNADELVSWISTVRGPTATVIEHERPVELVNHYLVADRLAPDLLLLPTLVGGRPNPDGDRLDAPEIRGPKHERYQRGRGRRRYSTPRRLEVVDRLVDDDLLPAIYFIFSRNGCEDAARTLLESGVRLTTVDERRRIRSITEHHVEHLSDVDLDVLDYDRFAVGLEAGIAPHHAGMVPPFKETVEACFALGLVKVVFATETLALGINMPARSVVIESLSKFTGERHEDLTPGQYTQLTGRAGRRGIDPVGHAIVLWSPFVSFDRVAALAASRDFPLASAFRPTYNMAANLVQRYASDEAHRLLNQSFAQYQADTSVVRLETRRAARVAALEAVEKDARCELGEVEEYRSLLKAEEQVPPSQPGAAAVEEALSRLKPGDVIRVSGDRAAVLSVAFRKGGAIKLRAVNPGGRLLQLGAENFEGPPDRLATLTLPSPFAPNNNAFIHQTSAALRRVRLKHAAPRHHPRTGASRETSSAAASHPVAGCPDRRAHLRAAAQADRIRREIGDIERRVASRTDSVAKRFDQVLGLLGRWGHLAGWSVTERGRVLARLYHETDLLVAEALVRGLLDDLDAVALAGVVSCFTYEHRSKIPPPPPWFPSVDVRRRVTAVEDIARRLNADEMRARLPESRLPDPTFLPLACSWAAGESFDSVLADEDLSGGDFVRNVKQLIDLLRQIAEVAPLIATGHAAGDAADRLFRGVVAVSSAVGGREDLALHTGIAEPPIP